MKSKAPKTVPQYPTEWWLNHPYRDELSEEWKSYDPETTLTDELVDWVADIERKVSAMSATKRSALKPLPARGGRQHDPSTIAADESLRSHPALKGLKGERAVRELRKLKPNLFDKRERDGVIWRRIKRYRETNT